KIPDEDQSNNRNENQGGVDFLHGRQPPVANYRAIGDSRAHRLALASPPALAPLHWSASRRSSRACKSFQMMHLSSAAGSHPGLAHESQRHRQQEEKLMNERSSTVPVTGTVGSIPRDLDATRYVALAGRVLYSAIFIAAAPGHFSQQTIGYA